MATGESLYVDQFSKVVDGILAAIETAPARQLFDAAKHVIWAGQSANFTLAESAYGEQWPLRQNHGVPGLDEGRGGWVGHPLLIDTGDMYQAVTGHGAGHVEETLDRMFSTGVSDTYAADHELGIGVPRRSFIEPQPEYMDDVGELVGDWGFELIVGVLGM